MLQVGTPSSVLAYLSFTAIMSRTAQHRPLPVAQKKDPRMGSGSSQDEVCPVCKSSRYLNPSLRFLVNPECYHKMCESCVDRIFSHGPAQCPISGCSRTLRRHKFREQTFEDIKVEREVDIRKRVAAVFNRREEDFEDLKAYNNYLNDVEDITFNLVQGIDLEETNRRFDAYEKANEKEILENAQLAQQENQDFFALQKAEKLLAKQRREAARREEEEERRAMEEGRRDVLDRLSQGQNADTVAREGQQVQLKKRMDRQAAAERQRQLQAASNGSSDLVIKGLKSRRKAEPEAPIDPFGGLSFQGMQYYSLQPDYVSDLYKEPKKDVRVQAGGYDVDAFASRAMTEAFAGLSVFIADEMGEREKANADQVAVGTARAQLGAQDVKM
nr:rna polymerase ii transcription factor b subunit 3 [Quercus suber]